MWILYGIFRKMYAVLSNRIWQARAKIKPMKENFDFRIFEFIDNSWKIVLGERYQNLFGFRTNNLIGKWSYCTHWGAEDSHYFQSIERTMKIDNKNFCPATTDQLSLNIQYVLSRGKNVLKIQQHFGQTKTGRWIKEHKFRSTDVG